MFNFVIHENVENACRAFDSFDNSHAIPGTMFRLEGYADGYRIGTTGRNSMYYRLKKKNGKLIAKSNVMTDCEIIIMGGIALFFAVLVIKKLINMVISGDYEGISKIWIVLCLITFFGLAALLPALNLKAIKEAIYSILDTSYYDMTGSVNPKLAAFENNRNKPLVDNSNVTVRRKNGKYVIGSFGTVPYYYYVLCDNGQIEYKLGMSGYVRIISSILFAVIFLGVDVFLIYGTANGSLTNMAGGILLCSFFTLIGIVLAIIPKIYQASIDEFISSI